jgi:hypothetical protein
MAVFKTQTCFWEIHCTCMCIFLCYLLLQSLELDISENGAKSWLFTFWKRTVSFYQTHDHRRYLRFCKEMNSLMPSLCISKNKGAQSSWDAFIPSPQRALLASRKQL